MNEGQPLTVRAQRLAQLARRLLETPEEETLWQQAPAWRDFFAHRWHYGSLEARFDGDLRLLADLSDHIESMIYLHEMQQGDRGLVRYLKCQWRSGQIVLDVGANVGVISLMAAKRVRPQGRVLAFEPVAPNAERLTANLALNGFTHVEVYRLALSDREGESRIWIPAHRNLGMCSLHEREEPGEFQPVKLTRLDSFLAEYPVPRLDWIKVDVEGHEMAFLRGARGVIARFRPAMAVELSRVHLARAGTSPQEIVKFYMDLNYATRGLTDTGDLTDLDLAQEHQNAVFLPR